MDLVISAPPSLRTVVPGIPGSVGDGCRVVVFVPPLCGEPADSGRVLYGVVSEEGEGQSGPSAPSRKGSVVGTA
jgi:hypothetical protein